LLDVAAIMTTMTAPTGPQRQRLAAVVRQRRAALDWSREKAAEQCGMAPMTYDRVEDGETVQVRTHGKVERGLGFAAGAFQAIFDGAPSVKLEDGGEMAVYSEGVVRPGDLEEDVRGALQTTMVSATNLDPETIRDITGRAIEELRRRGVLPAEGGS
jgi:transcriptional regulator with XRE-family HTH domain